ncbi:MAG: alpha/beta fold hydrolase [Limisphaerales bacterium]
MNEETEERLRIRIHGEADLPTLVYLPGLHGDWTLVASFRMAMQGKVRFVEFTYPRSLQWNLDDYANAIDDCLAENGITKGWLVGESFGSQIVWPLSTGDRKFKPDGVVLSGGFGRHPMTFGVKSARMFCGGIPLGFITWALFFYAPLARFRHRNAPEVAASFDEFIRRRTQLDKCAGSHRLKLIAENDPRELASQVKIPVYHLSGFWAPVVPWPLVRPWLKRHCPGYRGGRLVAWADHNVFGTGPRQAAEIVSGWMEA